MLKLFIPAGELWDEQKEIIIRTKEITLQLEHSLVSISKWESKWHKAFLGKQEKTFEEINDYIRCMTLTQNVDPNTYYFLTEEHYKAINQYIEDPMTATVLAKDYPNTNRNGDTPTAELIYYWMIGFQIPVEFQKWHLNRLLALIKLCERKNTAASKGYSKRDLMRSNAALNEARRKKYGSKG